MKQEANRVMKDNKLIVKIDGSHLPILVQEGQKLVMTPKAETAILKLLELEDRVAAAKKIVAEVIKTEALKINPNFTGVQADNIRALYRSYGQKYFVDRANIKSLPKELYDTEVQTVYKLKPAATIDKWVAENGGKLPLGLNMAEREKQMSLNKIGQAKSE